MPKPEVEHDLNTFAGRKAAREAREALQGRPERRQITNRVSYEGDSAPVKVVRHVQA